MLTFFIGFSKFFPVRWNYFCKDSAEKSKLPQKKNHQTKSYLWNTLNINQIAKYLPILEIIYLKNYLISCRVDYSQACFIIFLHFRNFQKLLRKEKTLKLGLVRLLTSCDYWINKFSPEVLYYSHSTTSPPTHILKIFIH